jgi:hypothetical protein
METEREMLFVLAEKALLGASEKEMDPHIVLEVKGLLGGMGKEMEMPFVGRVLEIRTVLLVVGAGAGILGVRKGKDLLAIK